MGGGLKPAALAESFLRRLGARMGREFTGIELESMERFKAFSWPGNVRQLQNIVEHSPILCDNSTLGIPSQLLTEHPALRVSRSWTPRCMTTSGGPIEQALQGAEGRVAGAGGAAERLGVAASTLESKIKRFDIDKLRYRAGREAGFGA